LKFTSSTGNFVQSKREGGMIGGNSGYFIVKTACRRVIETDLKLLYMEIFNYWLLAPIGRRL